MMDGVSQYINGYIEFRMDGSVGGRLTVEGIDLSPIIAVFFKKEGRNYLWLRRNDMLVYDERNAKYVTRKREPRWEAYLEKQMDEDSVAYKGEFYFLMFKFSIRGIWDKVFGKERARMNFFVERLPMERQDILNKLNEKERTNGRC